MIKSMPLTSPSIDRRDGNRQTNFGGVIMSEAFQISVDNDENKLEGLSNSSRTPICRNTREGMPQSIDVDRKSPVGVDDKRLNIHCPDTSTIQGGRTEKRRSLSRGTAKTIKKHIHALPFHEGLAPEDTDRNMENRESDDDILGSKRSLSIRRSPGEKNDGTPRQRPFQTFQPSSRKQLGYSTSEAWSSVFYDAIAVGAKGSAEKKQVSRTRKETVTGKGKMMRNCLIPPPDATRSLTNMCSEFSPFMDEISAFDDAENKEIGDVSSNIISKESLCHKTSLNPMLSCQESTVKARYCPIEVHSFTHQFRDLFHEVNILVAEFNARTLNLQAAQRRAKTNSKSLLTIGSP